MGLNWSNRIVADARLASVHGGRIAGGYVLRLGVEFDVHNWNEADPAPIVIMAPARVLLHGGPGVALGSAYPETLMPFTVNQYASKRGMAYELPLSPGAMEAIERHRNGLAVSFAVHLHAELRRGTEVQLGWCDVTQTFNVSQWIVALEQAGYGRTLLFEVPLPNGASGPVGAIELLETARRFLSSGHYTEVVANCRMVLERLTQELGEEPALAAARSSPGRGRTAEQRELLMRQAAIDFAHLAHHPTETPLVETFDRAAAQMMLGVTAALVSSAMTARAASLRQS